MTDGYVSVRKPDLGDAHSTVKSELTDHVGVNPSQPHLNPVIFTEQVVLLLGQIYKLILDWGEK